MLQFQYSNKFCSLQIYVHQNKCSFERHLTFNWSNVFSVFALVFVCSSAWYVFLHPSLQMLGRRTGQLKYPRVCGFVERNVVSTNNLSSIKQTYMTWWVSILSMVLWASWLVVHLCMTGVCSHHSTLQGHSTQIHTSHAELPTCLLIQTDSLWQTYQQW